jgi:hypothetical protein
MRQAILVKYVQPQWHPVTTEQWDIKVQYTNYVILKINQPTLSVEENEMFIHQQPTDSITQSSRWSHETASPSISIVVFGWSNNDIVKVKLSRYTPWRRLGWEEV